MRTFILAMTFAALAAPGIAQDRSTGFFGIPNPALAELYLDEAFSIAGITDAEEQGRTRSLEEFDEFVILRAAYRADPDATIDLIRRVLEAGGNT